MSGSGKSTLAQTLARRLELPWVELDALFWEPNWQVPDRERFRARLAEATSGPGWIADGNFFSAHDRL